MFIKRYRIQRAMFNLSLKSRHPGIKSWTKPENVVNIKLASIKRASKFQ